MSTYPSGPRCENYHWVSRDFGWVRCGKLARMRCEVRDGTEVWVRLCDGCFEERRAEV